MRKKTPSQVTLILDHHERLFPQVADITDSFNNKNNTNISPRMTFNGGAIVLYAPQGAKLGQELNSLAQEIQNNLAPQPVIISTDCSYKTPTLKAA